MSYRNDAPVLESVVVGTCSIILALTYHSSGIASSSIVIGLFIIGIAFFGYAAIAKLANREPIIDWLSQSILRAYFVGLIFIVLILLVLDVYFLESWKDVLVEAHGVVFDIILLGIGLYVITSKNENKTRINILEQELDDYRGHESDEAGFNVRKIIRELRERGVTVVDLENLHLGYCDRNIIIDAIKNKAYIASLEFADLMSENFEGEEFPGVCFKNSQLIEVNFTNAYLKDCDLSESYLEGVNFRNAFMMGVSLKNSYVGGANFKNANLHGVDFEGVTMLYYEYIKDAMTLYEATNLPSDLKDELLSKKPELFEPYYDDKIIHSTITLKVK